ncbi:type II toxin-antitoxin system RelB/DinJ family antitoxin [Thorsellia kenyensis]|uniref:Type II toxin-antitoxin system RelB/DinJ family antitoxin n=1 Tax=Thorsellia kenyensis TaxID=1549888 RepID=A0ABV6CBU6_9GAMM
MVNLQIRLENELKEKAQEVAKAMGMDLTTAVRIFLTQMVNERALPFRPELDLFYSPSNQKALTHSLSQLENGEIISKSLKDLQGME